MTCCVAAIANGGNAIVLVSDKMIGTSNKRGEPHGITKGEAIHKDWWALFAGDVSLAADIFIRLKGHFPDGPLSIYDARDALSTTLFEKWQSDTERAYLKKEGYTSETFRDEAPKKMAEEIYIELRERRLRHSLKAEIIIAGFDEQGAAHILSCNGFVGADQFVPANHDSEGFSAIGSGADGATWMMRYRDVNRDTRRRDAAYYAVEGIYYAELGSGVGESADLILIRPNKKARWVGARAVDKAIIPICRKLRPGKLSKKYRRKLKRKVRGIKIYPALNGRALSAAKSSFGDIPPRSSKATHA
jgi:hypothetical protein